MQIKVTDVRCVKGDAAFLIDDGKTSILYDTGFAFTGNAVAQNVKRALGDRTLNYVFLTHSHYDHALGCAYVKRLFPNAKVVAGEYATKIFTKPTAKAVMRDLDGKFAAKCGVSGYEDLIDDLAVDISVKDGDTVGEGELTFTVFNLPGHTKCSVGYYCEKHKLFLGCETLGVFNGVDDVVPSYLVGYEMTVNSIERVKKLDIEKMLVPHFGLIDGDIAKFYLEKGEERAKTVAKKIVSMLNDGRDKEEIYQDFKETFYRGYIKEIYPIDAMKLNTHITIDLLEKELT